MLRLTKTSKTVILKSLSSRGGSGTLNQQSAIAGVMSRRGSIGCEAAHCKWR